LFDYDRLIRRCAADSTAGANPGTGKARVLDTATAMVKTGAFPEIGDGSDTTY